MENSVYSFDDFLSRNNPEVKDKESVQKKNSESCCIARRQQRFYSAGYNIFILCCCTLFNYTFKGFCKQQ